MIVEKETFEKIIYGKCKCGNPVEKIIGSNRTRRTDKVRYANPDDNEGWCLFRCNRCLEVIEDSFVPDLV